MIADVSLDTLEIHFLVAKFLEKAKKTCALIKNVAQMLFAILVNACVLKDSKVMTRMMLSQDALHCPLVNITQTVATMKFAQLFQMEMENSVLTLAHHESVDQIRSV